jgi:hypothetical protein
MEFKIWIVFIRTIYSDVQIWIIDIYIYCFLLPTQLFKTNKYNLDLYSSDF